MEESPENGKESSNSAHANGKNEITTSSGLHRPSSGQYYKNFHSKVKIYSMIYD